MSDKTLPNTHEPSALGTKLGATCGILLFLYSGLKAGFIYGGLIGAMTALALVGHPIGAELLTRMLVAGGMLLGVLAVGFILTVVGAIIGTLTDELAHTISRVIHAKEKPGAKTDHNRS